MLNFFRRKTVLEKLLKERKHLLNQSFIASKNSRKLSDKLLSEAAAIEERIEKIIAAQKESDIT
jgi:hypothetical protein